MDTSSSSFLDSILAEQDDEAIIGNLSIDDVLNDKAEFSIESVAPSSLETSESSKEVEIESKQPNIVLPSNTELPSPENDKNTEPISSNIEISPNTPEKRLENEVMKQPSLHDVLNETDDLELSQTSNINMDTLLKSIISDKGDRLKDDQLMKKVRDYETRVMNVDDSKKLLKTLEERRRKVELNSSIIKTTRLEKIGNQIVSPQMKKTAGSPTCIYASSKYIVIGTSHGLTLVFDHFQVLKAVLGSNDGVEYGRVYSVAISADSDYVVVGHHLGQIVVWDLTGGKVLKIILNEAPLSLEQRGPVPIIYVEFLEGKKQKIIACSLDGVLNIHTLKRVFMVTMIDTLSVLNGTSGNGSVLAVAPLHPGAGRAHPIDTHSLLACATFKRVVVISSQDKNNVIYHLKRPNEAREGSLPYLAWRDLISGETKTGAPKLLDPVLAIGWGTTIVLVQIVQALTDQQGHPVDPTEISSLVFRTVATHTTDREITGLYWLGTGVLVYTNSADELRVIDPFSLEEIEIDQIKQMELVYHSKFAGTRTQLGSGIASPSPTRSPSKKPNLPPMSQKSQPSMVSKNIPKSMAIDESFIDMRSKNAKVDQSIAAKDAALSQSFHNSMFSFRGKLYMMGLKAPFVAVVLGWSERITAMAEKGRWLDALAAALDFCHGRAKAVKGLPRDPRKAAAKIGAKIEQLLYDYAKTNLNIAIPKDPTHFDMVATVCIDYCLILGRQDILFQLLFPLFQTRKKAGLLLEKLEPFILGDKLTSLPPEIIQQIVKHYMSNPLLVPKMEQLLLHLDMACLDFHSIVKLCVKHHLSTALFHLYINGLNDYITPMDHLMKVLVNDMDFSNEFSTLEQIELKRAIGCKIILYLSYVFKGLSFPSEKKIPARLAEELRESIFDYLLITKIPTTSNVDSRSSLNKPEDRSKTLNQVNVERFPRVRVLLHVDSSEFLNILQHSLDSMSSTARLKQWIDVLMEIMVDPTTQSGSPTSLFWTDKPSPTWPFKPRQIADLYHFIAHFFNSGSVDISSEMIRRITGYTLLCDEPESKAKRETTLLELLRACPEDRLDYSKLSLLAESAKFYKVCDFFFTYRRDFAAVVRCHLLDSDFRKRIFSFVAMLIRSKDPNQPDQTAKSSQLNQKTKTTVSHKDERYVEYRLTEKEKTDVKNACIEKIIDLIALDNEKTAELVMKVLKVEQSAILAQLDPTPESQLSYLKACLSISIATQEQSNRQQTVAKKTSRKPASSPQRQELPNAQLESKPALDLGAGEKLLELLCKFEPNTVASWLKEHEQLYRLDAAIEITRRYNITLAYCQLQETAGDLPEVLRILLQSVNDKLEVLYQNTRNTSARPPFGIQGVLSSQPAEEDVQNFIDESVYFLKRNHQRMSSVEGQQLWFRLLDAIIIPLGEVESLLLDKRPSKSANSVSRFDGLPKTDLELIKYHLNKIFSRILDSMIGYVELSAILEKILQDRVDSRISDCRDIFVRLMENYSHERNILTATAQVIKGDTHHSFADLVRARRQAIKRDHITRPSPSMQSESEEHLQTPEYLQRTEASRLQILHEVGQNSHPHFSLRDQLKQK